MADHHALMSTRSNRNTETQGVKHEQVQVAVDL